MARPRLALEASGQSAWIAQQLRGYDREVIAANPRQLHLNHQKHS